MANFVFNIAKGRIAEKVSDGATLRLLLLKGAGSDAVLKDFDTIADLLAEGSTTEADFTNYARQTLGSLTATVDDGNDDVDVDCSDVVFTSAGGASNNTIVAAVIYEFVTNDADSIPLTKHDVSFTTNGNTITLTIHADGFFGAS